MKVAILCQDLCGQGAQYAMAAIARGLADRGVEVDMLLSQVNKDRIREGGVPFALPPMVKVIYLPSRKARYNVWAIRKYMKTAGADAIMATSGPYHKSLRLAAVGLRRRPMLVYVDHGNFGWDESKSSVVKNISSWTFVYWRLRFRFSVYDRMLVVNETARQNFLRLIKYFPAEHVFNVYNPVIDELFCEKIKQAAQHPWLVKKECPTFVAAGAYCPCKEHILLLKAFREIAKTERARLIIFGKGALEVEYRKFIRDNHLEDVVSVGGYTNCLPAEMKAADGFLLSSNLESFGIVIVEALACGLPVVSTDAPFGPREVLKDGKYGTLIPVGDYQAMAQEVIKLIHTPGTHPPEESWKSYTLEAATDRYLAALK